MLSANFINSHIMLSPDDWRISRSAYLTNWKTWDRYLFLLPMLFTVKDNFLLFLFTSKFLISWFSTKNILNLYKQTNKQTKSFIFLWEPELIIFYTQIHTLHLHLDKVSSLSKNRFLKYDLWKTLFLLQKEVICIYGKCLILLCYHG